MAIELGHAWVARVDGERERARAFAAVAREWVAPLLVGAALAGLFLVALRGNILQLRYQLDAGYRLETQLGKERAALTARYWGLRDPGRLEARARGDFVIPGCVVRVRPDGSRPTAGCGR